MPVPMIIDTDTASDDAVALIMALRTPEVEVKAITIVAGNVNVQQGTRNARYTVELCDADVPVYEGAAHPLVREPSRGVVLPRPRRPGGTGAIRSRAGLPPRATPSPSSSKRSVLTPAWSLSRWDLSPTWPSPSSGTPTWPGVWGAWSSWAGRPASWATSPRRRSTTCGATPRRPGRASARDCPSRWWGGSCAAARPTSTTTTSPAVGRWTRPEPTSPSTPTRRPSRRTAASSTTPGSACRTPSPWPSLSTPRWSPGKAVTPWTWSARERSPGGMTVVDELDVVPRGLGDSAGWRPAAVEGTRKATVCWEIDAQRFKKRLFGALA